MNIDIGGQKHRRDLKGLWKIVDSSSNADFVFNLNKSRPLPFKDNSVDNIYTSHTLEHIDPVNLTFVFRDFCRVLKPNGKCRVVVPDCRHAIKLYLKNPKELSNKKYCSKLESMPSTAMGFLTAWFHTNKRGLGTGHKLGFDDELLRAFIARSKFKAIQKMSYNKCSPIFNKKDYERYASFSLYYELTK